MFGRVLVANRGEIAVRVIRALHELDVEAVAIYSTADEHALHVKLADQAVCIGPPAASESYLRIPSVVACRDQPSSNSSMEAPPLMKAVAMLTTTAGCARMFGTGECWL